MEDSHIMNFNCIVHVIIMRKRATGSGRFIVNQEIGDFDLWPPPEETGRPLTEEKNTLEDFI